MLDDRIQQSEVTETDWILGRLDAPVTLLVYGDFECRPCARARRVLQRLVADAPEVIRLVYRHFPISTSHPRAMLAAEAAEAAGSQGRFWEMHDLIYDRQNRIEREHLVAYAVELGLDRVRFEHELNAHIHVTEVKFDFRRGIQDGVNGTPTLYINRRRYDGPTNGASILAAIAAPLTQNGEFGAPAPDPQATA
jgi:protein-disulfide isomerase